MLQRSAANQASAHQGQHITDNVLHSPGQPLDAGTHAFMESRFGYDFSGVSVHTNAKAAQTVRNYQLNGNRECAAAIPAGLANSLANHNGQPLPETLRTEAEQQFGFPLTHVRLHLGAEAHRMARGLNARAFTLGENVVFRAGQYAPNTPVGRHLLWHELSHVVAPPSEPRVLRAPLYETTNWSIPMLPTGHTAKSMRDLVDKKIANKEITSAVVKGTTAGSEAEIFLLHILWQLGKLDRWDTMIRLETAIGWEQKVGAGSGIIPTGLVTVTIDDKGNATAELLQAVPLALLSSLPAADAIKKLQTDFGVGSVAVGDKPWSNSDLADVVAAFARLPASDQAALKGVDLLRFTTLPKEHAGEFNKGGGVAKDATTVTSRPTLKLADSAFSRGERVVGDVAHQAPASFQTILHEAGHAVEAQAERAAQEPLEEAIIKQNRAAGALNTTLAKLKKATGADATALRTDAVAKRKVYDAAVAVEKKKDKAFKATRVSDSVIKPLVTAADAKKTACEAAIKTANAVVKGFSQPELSDSAAYRVAVHTVKSTLDDYVKKTAPDSGIDLDSPDDALLAAIAKRNEAREALKKAIAGNPALATFAPIETAQDAWADAAQTLAHTRGRTLRLDKFVTVVNTAKITPFTQYARDNWPYKPEEFYAEAYSLWLTEPEFVKNQYKPIFDFFDRGDYLK